MLNIHSIFKFILIGLQDKAERFVILDDEHVMDSNTGVELHLYDGWFKVTRGEEVIVEMDNLSDDEKSTLWEIKTEITNPVVMQERKDNYMGTTKKRREKLSDLFEYPEPIMVKSPIVETDTEDYVG